mgnify:CR=1 FL=1
MLEMGREAPVRGPQGPFVRLRAQPVAQGQQLGHFRVGARRREVAIVLDRRAADEMLDENPPGASLTVDPGILQRISGV